MGCEVHVAFRPLLMEVGAEGQRRPSEALSGAATTKVSEKHQAT